MKSLIEFIKEQLWLLTPAGRRFKRNKKIIEDFSNAIQKGLSEGVKDASFEYLVGRNKNDFS